MSVLTRAHIVSEVVMSGLTSAHIVSEVVVSGLTSPHIVSEVVKSATLAVNHEQDSECSNLPEPVFPGK